MSTQPCSQPECAESDGAVALLIESKAKDLGDFEVRRVLPAPSRQRVGPFIFFDHMGPADFAPGQGIGVRPHPHIGLATVTYLFEGVIQHRDSLGFDQPIEPGAVNWMTAGRGIVHSERTPEPMRAAGSRLHGLQIWLALPHALEETEPAFVHHPADTIPHFTRPGVDLALIAGNAMGLVSPVEVASPMFYLAGEMQSGAEVELPNEHPERAVYVVEGRVELDGRTLEPGTMAVLCPGVAATIRASADSRVAMAGGAPIEGEAHPVVELRLQPPGPGRAGQGRLARGAIRDRGGRSRVHPAARDLSGPGPTPTARHGAAIRRQGDVHHGCGASRSVRKSRNARVFAGKPRPGGSMAASSLSWSMASSRTVRRRPASRSSLTMKCGSRAIPWSASASTRIAQPEVVCRRPVATIVSRRPPTRKRQPLAARWAYSMQLCVRSSDGRSGSPYRSR